MDVKIDRSSRHSKITGNFSEQFVLYWLSKFGFECAYIDHVGIDIIARKPKSNEIMGISVKSRSRTEGKEEDNILITKHHFENVKFACNTFRCVPYFAFVADVRSRIYIFILSLEKFHKLFPIKKSSSSWRMSIKNIEDYKSDKDIMMIELNYSIANWFRS